MYERGAIELRRNGLKEDGELERGVSLHVGRGIYTSTCVCVCVRVCVNHTESRISQVR